MRTFISGFFFILWSFAIPSIYAQIGYQVALLNTATGEPQANKTVNVNIAITNSENKIVYTEIQTATTNDFGVLSLSVGKEDMFKNADWNKLPFYIAVSADGTLIGKSQILTVPVAEYAKTAGTVLTKEMIVGKWSNKYAYTNGEYTNEAYNYIIFNEDGTGIKFNSEVERTYNIIWKIKEGHIYIYLTYEEEFKSYNYKILYYSEPLCLINIYSFDINEKKINCVEGNDPIPKVYSKE